MWAVAVALGGTVPAGKGPGDALGYRIGARWSSLDFKTNLKLINEDRIQTFISRMGKLLFLAETRSENLKLKFAERGILRFINFRKKRSEREFDEYKIIIKIQKALNCKGSENRNLLFLNKPSKISYLYFFLLERNST